MTPTEFLDFFESRLKTLKGVTASAQKEYASSANTFDNFNRLADDLDMDRKKVLYVYLKKHLDAIRNYLNDPSTSIREPITGRIGDAIVYLVILDAMIQEEPVAQYSCHSSKVAYNDPN